MELIEVLRAELESESARVADVLPGPSFPLRFRRIVAIIPLQESKLNLAYFDYPTPPPPFICIIGWGNCSLHTHGGRKRNKFVDAHYAYA